MQKCSICGKFFEEWGNNAQPVSRGTCCNVCNITVVIPRRMQDFENKKQMRKELKENG